MGRTAVIYTLPAHLRQTLAQKIIENGYGNYVFLSEWLRDEGYTVSKSSLHRFGQELKTNKMESIADEFFRSAVDSQALVELRMRCLESAAITNPDDAVQVAKRYLNWVLSGG
ncbi:DUF3486 family protein [Jeongeupia wiesaeckerbachi]|uniref:phage protein Gp27 family protein n=1 Tax=Jeongeupia wiesaeckerbachi TaxID=3051218 RepID=UPI003D8073D5